MQLNVQARPFKLTPALEASVVHNLKTVEDRFGEHINKILVRMDDINGHRGGIDKRCRIVINANSRQTVVAEALSEDMYQSISKAAKRAESALNRSMRRRREAYAPKVSFTQKEETE